MVNIHKAVNEYLFYEFGKDLTDVEYRISENWPFTLQEVVRDQYLSVFEFVDDQEYFALVGRVIEFFPKVGMGLEDIRYQHSGSQWIKSHQPISLSMSILGDSDVPSTMERRSHLEKLGIRVSSGQPFEILEGLYLKDKGQYLGLFRVEGIHNLIVGGLSGQESIPVPFPAASTWRRLAWGVGWWLKGRLG